MIKMSDLVVSEDFKSQAKKFIESGIDRRIVDSYIEKFKKIRDAKLAIAKNADIGGLDVPKGNTRFDIDKYRDFKQLEIFVDYVAGQVARVSTAGQKFDSIEVDANTKPLVTANGLEIYYAKDKHACIKYKGDKPYSWCVARSDSSNMYNTYRYKENEPSFYFVKDVAATQEEFREPFTGEFKNPWHFFVVQATPYQNQFIVTNADNEGDNQMNWEDLVSIVPKLDGLQNYFKHVPLTPKEKEQYNKFVGGVDDATFVKLSYEEKEAYLDIAVPNNELTDVQFASLPPDLKNKFVGFGIGLTEGQYEMIKSDKNLIKRYYQISLRKYKEYLKYPHGGIRILDSEYDIILKTPEGKSLVTSGGRDEMMKMVMNGVSIKKLLDIFGHDGIVVIQENANHFLAHSTANDLDYIFSLIPPEKLTSIDAHTIFNAGLSRKYGYKNDIPTDYVYALINALLKYKGKISERDLILVPDDIDNTPILCDYFVDLYAKGKTEGFEKEYRFFFLRTGDFVKTYNVFGGKKALDTIHPQYLAELFMNYFKNESIPNRHQILALISDSLKGTIRGYDISKSLMEVSTRNHPPEKLQELIQYFGGVESIRSKLDIIAPLFSKEQLDMLDSHKITEFLFRPTAMEKIASIIGPVAITKVDDYSIYSILKKFKTDIYDRDPTISERFIDILIQYKGPNLSFNVDNSNLASFLMFSNDLDKIVKVFGLEKIRAMKIYDVWRIITHREIDIKPEKFSKLLKLFGKDLLTKMAMNIRSDRHVIFETNSVIDRELLIPYVNDTIPPHAIVYLLSHLGEPALSKYINLIGANNVRKISKDGIRNIIKKDWGQYSMEGSIRALIPIFGKEYMKEICQEFEFPLIPELLQEEYLSYKHYYV